MILNYADAQTPRTIKELKELVKNKPTTNIFEFSTLGVGFNGKPYKFVLFRDVDKSLINSIEQELIDKYKYVAVCFKGGTFQHCYWVQDSVGLIGLYKLDGTLLVPPVRGKIHQLWRDNTAVGEIQFNNETNWIEALTSTIQSINGIGLGHFCAVVDNITNDKINAKIPYGKYDDIMMTIKGTKPNFFVAKLVSDSLKWGVCNLTGKEIEPCIHKGIYKEDHKVKWLIGNTGGKWKTTEDMDMDQATNMVQNREALAQERRMRFNEIMQAIGNTLIIAGETMESIDMIKNGDKSSNSSTGKDIGSGSYQSRYNSWENRAKQNYGSLTNLGLRAKKDGKDIGGTSGQGMSGSNYVQMKKYLYEAQREMKTIRQEASKKGIKINKSEYEDISVSY